MATYDEPIEERPPEADEPGAQPEEEQTEQPTALPRPEDAEVSEKANLAAALTEEQAKKFVSRCVERYNRDLKSREPRMRKLKDLQEMYAMIAKPKSFPWNGAANVRTPTVAGPSLQIQARLFDMLIPASGDLFNVIAATSDERELAQVGEAFGNTYLRYFMPEFEQGMDYTIHETCLYGSAFRRTYADQAMRKICSDPVSVEDFVVAAGHRSRDPSMSNVEFYTYVHNLSVADIKAFGDDGVFINTDKIKDDVNTANEGSALKQAIQKADGVEPDDEFQPHQVLECHCRYDLPKAPGKHPALDGKRHWLVIWIDWPSEQILRMSLREEDDPDDRKRFERETAKQQQYMMELETYQAALMMAMQPQMDPMTGALMQPPPPPAPPEPVPEPTPIRKRQICFFTHYRCFESGGFYGLGYGDILYGLALAKNTLINQHIDGVTLKNAKPLFMSRQVRMQRGNIAVRPGEVVEIDGPVNQIRDALMWLDPPANDPSTVPLIQMLDGMSDILVGSADMMSGQVPGSNQAATSIQIFAEQAMMPITVLGRRLVNCFKHELYKIWRCFGVFLSDEEIQDIARDSGKPVSMEVGKWLFSPTARLVPASDPRTKQQRAQEFQQLAGFVGSNPLLAQNPAAHRELAALGLKLFPDGQRLAQFLPPPPEEQQQQGPPPPIPHWAEEAAWLKGEDPPVNPADDDELHIMGHEAFLSSPAAQTLDKNGRNKAEQHLRNQYAARHEKGMKALDEQRAAIAGAAPGAPPAVPGPMGGGPVPMEIPAGDIPIGGPPPS